MKKVIPLLVLAALSGSLQAETFYLKGGKKIVGKQISKDGKNTVIEYYPDKGIKERMTVPNDRIKKVTREDIEDAKFKEIQKLLPTADLLEVEWYKKTLAEVIDPFNDEFPRSKHRFEVRDIARTLKSEMELIQKGGVKLDGTLINAEERIPAAYDIDSKIVAKGFHDAVKKKKYSEAIIEAEKLKLDFPKSKAYGEVVDEMPKMLKKYERLLKAYIAARKEVLAKRTKTIAELEADGNEQRLRRLKNAIEQEEAPMRRKVERQRKDGVKWISLNPYSIKDLNELLQKVEDYKKEFAEFLKTYEKADAGRMYTHAWKLIQKKKFEKAKEEIDKLELLGMNIAYFGRVEEYYAEERDLEDERKRNERRGREADLFDLYADVDEYLQETILEGIEHVKKLEDGDAATAKKTRGKLKSLTSRFSRLYKRRAGLKKMEPQDMESQNAEFAQVIEPLVKRYNEAHEAMLKKTEFGDVVRQPMVAFQAALPNPDDYLSEKVKLQIAEMEKRAQGGDGIIYVADPNRVPEQPVLTDDELKKMKFSKDFDVNEALRQKLEKHCPNKQYQAYRMAEQYVYNFNKGKEFKNLDRAKQIDANIEALKMLSASFEGKNISDIVVHGDQVLKGSPWVKEFKDFLLKNEDGTVGKKEVLIEKVQTLDLKIPTNHKGGVAVKFKYADSDVGLDFVKPEEGWGVITVTKKKRELEVVASASKTSVYGMNDDPFRVLDEPLEFVKKGGQKEAIVGYVTLDGKEVPIRVILKK